MVVDIDLRAFGGSALTDDAVDVPKHDSVDEIDGDRSRSPTCRRATPSSCRFALALAEVRGAADIFIGVNALDYSGYPDCRPEFIDGVRRDGEPRHRGAASRGAGITIHTPLIELTKAEIVRLGLELGVDYALTISCYDPTPDGAACGRCDACLLRRKGFADAGRRRSQRATPTDAPARAMTYAVKEVFYTLQGEGRAGGSAVGVLPLRRAATSGPAARSDRADAICRFCDTDFVGTDGPGGGGFRSRASARRRTSRRMWPTGAARASVRRVHRRRAAAAARRGPASTRCTREASRSRSRPTARCPYPTASTGSA